MAGSGTPGYGGDGGAAASAQLNLPIGVAVDSSGNVYIADFGNSRVRKVSASGAIIGTVAGSGSTGYSGDGGPAANAQLNGPQGVAVDAAGNLYIADTENNLIREVTPAGLIATVAGNSVAGYSGDGGQATSAQIGNPVGVAVDAAGNIFTVDASNRVRQVYPNGLIATIAGNGSRGYSGDGGLATQAQLNSPSAIALGSNGNLYVADDGQQRRPAAPVCRQRLVHRRGDQRRQQRRRTGGARRSGGTLRFRTGPCPAYAVPA